MVIGRSSLVDYIICDICELYYGRTAPECGTIASNPRHRGRKREVTLGRHASIGILVPVLGVFGFALSSCESRPTAQPSSIHPTAASAPSEAAAPNANGIRFVDVAQEAGLDYRWEVPGNRPLNILQTIGNGCAFLDYDADGNLDILLVGPRVALYRGDGKGRFTDVSRETGLSRLSGHFLGCAVGDYDNDGYPDIYLTAYRGGALLHNESRVQSRELRGTMDRSRLSTLNSRLFREVTSGSGIPSQPWSTSASFTDIDGDGKLDLYICNYVQFGPKTIPQLCPYAGRLSACGPRFYEPEFGKLYRNLGGGRFQDITKAWRAHRISGKGLGVTAADFDGSGRQSIAIANDEMPGDLLHNLGGKFENIGDSSSTGHDSNGNVHGGMGIDWGDYDNDGKLDLFVATFQHEAKCIYHNDGGGLFTENSAALGMEKALPYVAFGSKWIDCDNDGWLDLMIANGHVQDNIHEIDKSATYRQPTQLFRNLSGSGFKEITAQAGPSLQKKLVGRGLAMGDYDNDGRIDALVVDSEGAPLLLHNETTGAGNWLSIRLIGTRSNRDGIGALVTVEANGKKFLRLCTTDGSYMSASDRRVHVGLGQATSATIRVQWPSGAFGTYKNIAVNRFVTIREGKAQVE